MKLTSKLLIALFGAVLLVGGCRADFNPDLGVSGVNDDPIEMTDTDEPDEPEDPESDSGDGDGDSEWDPPDPLDMGAPEPEGPEPEADPLEPCDPWWTLEGEEPCYTDEEPYEVYGCRPLGTGGPVEYEFHCYPLFDEAKGPVGMELEDPCNATHGMDTCKEGFCLGNGWPGPNHENWPLGHCIDVENDKGCCTAYCDQDHPCDGDEWDCIIQWDMDQDDWDETGYCGKV